jgi:hypothetical protein
MALTNSEAEGWRMRSRKSCQASGAVEDPKASAPPSIVVGSGRGRGLGGSDQRADLVLNCRSGDGSGERSRLAADSPADAAIFGFLYCFGCSDSPRRSRAGARGVSRQAKMACPASLLCNLHVCIHWPVKGRLGDN